MAKRRLSTEATVFNAAGEVLLVRPGADGRMWELPGGKVKKRESLVEGIVREVEEETGISVAPEKLIGIYFIREELFHDFVFVCRIVGANPTPRPRPPEIVECGFFAVDRLPEPIRPFTVERIREARDGVSVLIPVELRREDWVK